LYLLQRSDIAELTIEDPSEAFQDMRDKVDYRTLVAAGVFDGIVAPVDPVWRETTRKEWKLGSRQFYRLIEMALRSDLLNALEEDASSASKAIEKGQSKDIEKDYRLMVKERLCRFNYEILAPMDNKERKDTPHQTYESVVDEYDRLLEQIAA
jgi:histone acetyltransferase 1